MNYLNSLILNVNYENKNIFSKLTDTAATPLRWAAGNGKYTVETDHTLVRHRLSDKTWKRIFYRTTGIALTTLGTVTLVPLAATLIGKVIAPRYDKKLKAIYQNYENPSFTEKTQKISNHHGFISNDRKVAAPTEKTNTNNHYLNGSGKGNISDPAEFEQRLASTKEKIASKTNKSSNDAMKQLDKTQDLSRLDDEIIPQKGSSLMANCSAGWYTATGTSRPTNEDAHLVKTIEYHQKNGETLQLDLAAVFDGHGGSACSTYAEENFERIFLEELKNQDQSIRNPDFWTDESSRDLAMRNALKNSFVTLHYDYQIHNANADDGSTACVNIICQGKIYTANAGDSRTVYRGQNQEICALSWDHIAKDCIKGVNLRGGVVFGGKVNRDLAVARAIGDFQITGMTPRPSFMMENASKGYLINGCDGLWDVCTPKTAFETLDEFLENNSEASCEDLAEHLGRCAIFAGSKDNVSVVVVKV